MESGVKCISLDLEGNSRPMDGQNIQYKPPGRHVKNYTNFARVEGSSSKWYKIIINLIFKVLQIDLSFKYFFLYLSVIFCENKAK